MNAVHLGSLVGSVISGMKARPDIKLDHLPKKDREAIEAQMKLQQQQEVVTFITNLLKKRHETTMSIINNIK
jgi:hypothetical protein